MAVVLAAGMLPKAGAGGVAHQSVVAADPAEWTPHVLDGEVRAVVQVGNRVVVGGAFEEVREAASDVTLRRPNLFAFDASTGVVDRAFAPRIDGRVEALAPGGDGAVFVAGDFDAAGTEDLVKLDLTAGQPTSGFAAPISGRSVEDLVVRGGRLFLGGAFSAVGSQPRAGLAAVDVVSGAVDDSLQLRFTDPRAGHPRVEKLDVTDDGATLVAIGNFTRVSGYDRHQIAVVELTASPARLADWHTNRYADRCSSRWDTYMRDVDISPDGTYFVVVTSGARARPTLCDSAARWELATRGSELQPSWVDYSGGDSFTAVGVSGAAVYVGGHQRWMNNPYPRGTAADARPGPGAVPRSGIAALDPINGLPLSWNPGRTRGAGAYALVPTADGLWVGSDTDQLGGEYHGRLALCPLVGGTPAATPAPATLPGDLYALTPAGELVRRPFDGTSAGAAEVVASGVDWSAARGAFLVGDLLYTGWNDGRLEVRRFDGDVVGPAEPVDLRGLRHSHFPVRDVTGMFLVDGRLYYSVAGVPELHFRYFTGESRVVGAEEFTVQRHRDDVDWSTVNGLTYASGRIYYGSGDGALRSVAFAGGRPVPGSDSLVADRSAGGPDGWPARGMFIFG